MLWAGNYLDTNPVGDIIITGTINTSGGNCSALQTLQCSGNAGNGGDVILESDAFADQGTALTSILIAGFIQANGGFTQGGIGYAGNSGDFEIHATGEHRTNIFVTGTIGIFGGSSMSNTGMGGNGGFMQLYTGHEGLGAIVLVAKDVNAKIDFYGGRGVIGGNGGHLVFWGYDSSIILDHNLDGSGGDGTSDIGGNGGYVQFSIRDGDVHVVENCANILAKGGSSSGGSRTVGGAGGGLTITNSHTGDITLSGVFNGDGGDGGEGGGTGLGVGMIVQLITDRGNINSSMDISLNGGIGRAFSGGDAGILFFWSDSGDDDLGGDVINSGSISVNGGKGVQWGGRGGIISLSSDLDDDDSPGNGIGNNSGEIWAKGGDGSVNVGTGGDGGRIELYAVPNFQTTVPITPNVNTAGGDPNGADGTVILH
jgi:hypothetical protein